MTRTELEAGLEGHGSSFRRHAREVRQVIQRTERRKTDRLPSTSLNKWQSANPESDYFIGGIIVKGSQLAEGVKPINATEIEHALAVETLPINSRSREFEDYWQRARNKRFEILWQRALDRCHGFSHLDIGDGKPEHPSFGQFSMRVQSPAKETSQRQSQ